MVVDEVDVGELLLTAAISLALPGGFRIYSHLPVSLCKRS